MSEVRRYYSPTTRSRMDCPGMTAELAQVMERVFHRWADHDGHDDYAGLPCECLGTGWIGVLDDQPWQPCATHNRGARELLSAGCLHRDHPGCARCHPRARRDRSGELPDRDRVPRRRDLDGYDEPDDPAGIF